MTCPVHVRVQFLYRLINLFPYIDVASHVFVVSVMCIFKKVNPRKRPSRGGGRKEKRASIAHWLPRGAYFRARALHFAPHAFPIDVIYDHTVHVSHLGRGYWVRPSVHVSSYPKMYMSLFYTI